MITVELLDSLPVGTPIELVRANWSTLHFIKREDKRWLRIEDDLVFSSLDFKRKLDEVRLQPLETLAALAKENT